MEGGSLPVKWGGEQLINPQANLAKKDVLFTTGKL